MNSKHPQTRKRLRKPNRPNVTILLSGGIDSAACLDFYLDRRFEVGALFVDYGQISARREGLAARAIARHYRVPFRIIRLASPKSKGPGLIHGRNAFLLLTALMESTYIKGSVALGIHAGTSYHDCSPIFVRKMQSIFDLYTGGAIHVSAPFLKWRKSDIWAFARNNGVPLQLTYSCERGLPQPCGTCNSCQDMEKLNAGTLHKD